MRYPLPELSRRAAACIDAPMFLEDKNWPALRVAFIAALEKAPTFQDLPAKWQRVMLQAEEQVRNPPLSPDQFGGKK